MNNPKIILRQSRNFGQVFNASFGYLKQNFKSFFGSILLLAAPVVTIIALIAVFLLNNVINTVKSNPFGIGNDIFGFILQGIVIGVFFLLLQALHVSIINQHMISNEEKGAQSLITGSELRKGMLNPFLRVLGQSFLMFLVLLIPMVVFMFAYGFFLSIFFGMGAVGVVLGMLIHFSFIIIISPVMAYFLMAVMFTVQKDKTDVITAFSRVFKYLKGNFWSTWLVSFIGYLISYLGTLFMLLPGGIFVMISIFTRINLVSQTGPDISLTTIIIGAIIFIVTILLILCVSSIYLVMCGFHAASLEEKKEGKSILEKINTIE